MTRFTLLACALLLCGQATGEQIYKTTDENGNLVFTDRPPAGGNTGETVQLRRLNTTPAPETTAGAPKQPDAPSAPLDYRVSIISPEDGSTIPTGPGNFQVQVTAAPELAPGEELQLRLDDGDHGERQRTVRWSLKNIPRGAHELAVRRYGADGTLLTTSIPVTVYVHRPTDIDITADTSP